MALVNPENPRYRFVQPEVIRIDDEPGVPSGPTTPTTPSNPRTDEPLLPFEDRDLPPILNKPYRLVVNSYNSVINKINAQNKTLYEHETAYNKGDYSFAGGSKETAKSIIENDKSKIEELKTKLKELEFELDTAATNDPVGAGKCKDNLKTYESYEDYKKRMDEANKANGTDDASSTGGAESTGVINTDKKEYRLPSNQAELKELLVGMGLATFNDNNQTITFKYHYEADEHFHSGAISPMSMDSFYNGFYGNNKAKFEKCLDNYASGAGWTKTDKVSGTDDASSTGGTDNSDSISQQLDAELQALQSELDTLNAELDPLNGELNTLNNDKTTLEGKKATLEQEINELNAQLEKAKNDLIDTQGLINAVGLNSSAYDWLANQRSELEAKITTLNSSIASKTSELGSINSQISTIDSAIKTKEDEISDKNQEIHDKQGDKDHRDTYLENNSDGSKMRFDTDYGVKNTSNDTTDTQLENYFKDLIKNKDGVPNDKDVKKLIDILTQYGVSNAEAYVKNLLKGDGKITDSEIKQLLLELKDKIVANGKGKTHDSIMSTLSPFVKEHFMNSMNLRMTMCAGVYCEKNNSSPKHYVWNESNWSMDLLQGVTYIDDNGNTTGGKAVGNSIVKDNVKKEQEALKKAIKDMGLRETNCKGVYCEQHNPNMPAGNYTHQRHYVWDQENLKMVELPGIYYISKDGHEANNDLVKLYANGTI